LGAHTILRTVVGDPVPVVTRKTRFSTDPNKAEFILQGRIDLGGGQAMLYTHILEEVTLGCDLRDHQQHGERNEADRTDRFHH
jgi:hypothetical protein